MKTRQTEFEEKLKAMKDQFGEGWGLVDEWATQNRKFRPSPPYDDFPNEDVPIDKFPKASWQTDFDYVGHYIDEGRNLVQRMKNAIYTEYGHSSKKQDGSTIGKAAMIVRNAMFGVLHHDPDQPVNKNNEAIDPKTNATLPGVAHMSPEAWNALVKKILHAMMTAGNLFVVVAGDDAAAGHGNNFIQSSIMQFYYFLEPVFHELGVNLVARNMAQKDKSVIYQAMGGGDLYGEIDVLLYSSTYAGETDGTRDLLYRQAILSGERVPIILTDKPGNLKTESSNTAWIGNLQPGVGICGDRKDGICDFEKHNSVCWVPRTDIEPPTPQDKDISPGAYPGVYKHQFEARKLTMMFLHAIEDALDQWNDLSQDSFPLRDEYWHIDDMDTKVRDALRESDKISDCERMIPKSLWGLCRVELHGFTEWTPVVEPEARRMIKLLHGDMNVSHYKVDTYYWDVDLLPIEWKPDFDVHAIPLVTSVKAKDEDEFDIHLLYDRVKDKPDANGANTDGVRTRERRLLADTFFSTEQEAHHLPATTESSMATSETTGTSLPFGQQPHSRLRQLQKKTPKHLPVGKGWVVRNAVTGYCDGSAQSMCGRFNTSTCLMAGHNDYTNSGFMGDDVSGWLVLRIPAVKMGILLARFEILGPNVNKRTEGWTKVDNGATEGNDGGDRTRHRQLQEFTFEFAIDGQITTWDAERFDKEAIPIADDMKLHWLMKEMGETGDVGSDDGTNIELSIRITSKKPRSVGILLTHIYYA